MQSEQRDMSESKQNSRLHKSLSLLAIWVLISVCGVLVSMLSVAVVFLVRDGSLAPVLQANASELDKNVALISMIVGAAIGLALALSLWQKLMRKTKFVSDQFIEKCLGGRVKNLK